MKGIKSAWLLFVTAVSLLGCSQSRSFTICVYERGIPSQKAITRTNTETIAKDLALIKGKLMNRVDTMPIQEVLLSVSGDSITDVYVDTNGEFQIRLKPGKYHFLYFEEPFDFLSDSLEVYGGEVIELEWKLGIDDMYATYQTDNPRKLKRRINKENRRRKRLYK